jgi:stage IV sporulation protein FB
MGRIHLGSILGTTITLDFSFLLVVAFFVVTDVQRAGMRYALLWIPVLFLSVLLHELAHAGTIGAFGFGPSQIVLEGIGGVTINQRKARPWQDLIISAAGPVSSFLLAWGIEALFAATPGLRRDPFFSALLPFLARANIWWGVLNLLPVLPLDGYGVVRNFLRMILSERTAFVIAIWISMLAGAALIVLALLNRYFLGALPLLWFVRSSFLQWQLFRGYRRPDD